MNFVKQKLDNKIQEIEYNKRLETGNVLSYEDVEFIFSELKSSDKEVSILLEMIHSFSNEYLNIDYLFVENNIKQIFKFYNIIKNDNVFNGRHQYFFNDKNKLIKKPYFSPKRLDDIKLKLKTNNIFKKMGITE